MQRNYYIKVRDHISKYVLKSLNLKDRKINTWNMFDLNTTYIKLRKSYKKNLPEYLALLNRYYPDFVYQNNPENLQNEIPIFTLHSVERNRFEKQLQFLSRNGYQTLIADHFYECLVGIKPVPERAIVLTFDDGWKNTWTVAYPLLKKYGFKAVCFIIPGLIKDDISHDTNLPEKLDGKATSKEMTYRDNDIGTLCTWEEIKKMHDSGTVDFQSHTMYHTLIFTSPLIEDFIHPTFDYYYNNFNVPIFSINGIDYISRNVELGMPIYENYPRYSNKRRYFDDVNLRNKCIGYVANNGGAGFFKRSNWRRKLLDVVDEHRRKYGEVSCFESEEKQRENIYKDLLESKQTIDNKLGGKTVNHLCYPWWVGCDLSKELSKKAGYLTNFWGIDKESRTKNRVGDDPYKVSRLLSDEYIFRLPGEGRKPLRKLIKEKIMLQYKGFIKG